ncbi:RNA helicase [Balamuthia mandrillaris]
MDTALFATYFNDCPLIEIPGRLFPVDIVYKPALDQDRSTIDHVLQCAVEITRSTRPSDGDILCFLTGQDEVESAKLTCQRVIDSDKLLKNKAKAFCLYGKQTPEEQREVFTKLGSGVRKIIFATDVAETSLTINGIRYVIDSGLTKDTVMPISKSSATQRKGHAGRTSSGTCYRLYSEDDYEAMKESITPELFRRPLNLLFATLLSMGVDPFAFDWLEPPDANALDNALNELIILKAVTVDNGDKRKELTDLGRAVAELQADPGIVHMLHSSCQRGFGRFCATLCNSMVPLAIAS